MARTNGKTEKQRDRSRSPKTIDLAAAEASWPKGCDVQFFHAADLTDKDAPYIVPQKGLGRGPRILQSHGWLDGTLEEAFSPSKFDSAKRDTYPLVQPRADCLFATRTCGKLGQPGAARRVHAQSLRRPSLKQPLLSLVFVRWSGEYTVGGDRDADDEPNDGDWGTFGAPASDHYMSAVMKKGLMAHPRLCDLSCADPGSFKFEAFSLFVRSSADVADVPHLAPWLATCISGKKTTMWWMLWPAEWEDASGQDYAAYVERRELYSAMRACEGAGMKTGFPHPADQYEMITSKSWMATLSLDPKARLPAAVMMGKAQVLSNPRAAAQRALKSIDHIRTVNPCHTGPGETAGPALCNQDGVKKGVVKLGWSWEARYVAPFNGEEDLAKQLHTMLTHPGCLASSCLVQEWVDFDFEMRLYFLLPTDWAPGQILKPERVECNRWEGVMKVDERRGFHRLSNDEALAKWGHDKAALKSARKQATECAQHLIAWLLTCDGTPVPMIRLDFMLLRTGPGQARVVFGEYCEMGACCLGWEEGPPTIWRAALDHALV